MTFGDRVPEPLARALVERGFVALTPIQRAVLDVDPPSRDMLVSAATGSGKTLAFGLALAAVVLPPDGASKGGAGGPLAFVITPTRELALQVWGELRWLYAPTGVRVALCTGGTAIRAEHERLAAGCEIVVGSPGRLRHHIARGTIDANRVAAIVLDEADEMLDLGFRDDLEFILNAPGAARQSLMFSATVTPRIEELAKRFQVDAVRIDIPASEGPHGHVRYEAVAVAQVDRENAIVNLLRFHDAECAIVFCTKRDGVGQLASRLSVHGFQVVALSGALTQIERHDALAALRDGRARVCVATDLAARGLDLPRLGLVIHADLPANELPLIHRSGRAGRAGVKGLAVLMATLPEHRRAERLIDRAGVAVDWIAAPDAADIIARDAVRLIAEIDVAPPATPQEHAAVEVLTGSHDLDAVALACVRLYGRARPAPAPLIGTAAIDLRPVRPDVVWFVLNLGRADNAEARSILPLVCRSGRVTRKDVGRIEVDESETRFEIRSEAAAAFEAAAMRGEARGPVIRRLPGSAKDRRKAG